MATYQGMVLDTNLEKPYMTKVISTTVGDKESIVFDHVALGDNFSSKDLTDAKIEFLCTLPNGKNIVDDTAGVHIDDAKNGIFTYTVPAAITQMSGQIGDARFRISKGSKVETSSIFKIVVYATPGIFETGKDYVDRVETYLTTGLSFVNDLEKLYTTADTKFKDQLTNAKKDCQKLIDDWTDTFTRFEGTWDETFKGKITNLQEQFDTKSSEWEAYIKKLNVDGIEQKITDIRTKLDELKKAVGDFDFLGLKADVDSVMSGAGGRNYAKDSKDLKKHTAKAGSNWLVRSVGAIDIACVSNGDFLTGSLNLESAAQECNIEFWFYKSGRRINSVSNSATVGLSGKITNTVQIKNIPNDADSVHLDLSNRSKTPEEISFSYSHVKIEKGTVPTDWTPALEDIEKKFVDERNYAIGTFAKKVNDEPIMFNKGFYTSNLSGNYSDLNDVVNPGFYGTLNAVAVNNKPFNENIGFTVFVQTLTTNYIKQMLIRFSDMHEFTRYKKGETWSKWVKEKNADQLYTKAEVDQKIADAIAALKK